MRPAHVRRTLAALAVASLALGLAAVPASAADPNVPETKEQAKLLGGASRTADEDESTGSYAPGNVPFVPMDFTCTPLKKDQDESTQNLELVAYVPLQKGRATMSNRTSASPEPPEHPVAVDAGGEVLPVHVGQLVHVDHEARHLGGGDPQTFGRDRAVGADGEERLLRPDHRLSVGDEDDRVTGQRPRQRRDLLRGECSECGIVEHLDERDIAVLLGACHRGLDQARPRVIVVEPCPHEWRRAIVEFHHGHRLGDPVRRTPASPIATRAPRTMGRS